MASLKGSYPMNFDASFSSSALYTDEAVERVERGIPLSFRSILSSLVYKTTCCAMICFNKSSVIKLSNVKSAAKVAKKN